MKRIIAPFCAFLLLAAAAWAGEADVIDVQVAHTGGQSFSFSVTVRHADDGWDHYADRWEVLAPDGTVLGTRVLLHPHEDEQPFTRSLSGVQIPASITRVVVRAHDSRHEWGGKSREVDLPGRSDR